jgi:hypothetical protein
MWPLWVTAFAGVALVPVTGVLAGAAWRGLHQLEVAIDQLEEVKRDRHVQVLDEMGRRWEGDEMTEALQMAVDYTPESLVRLFERAAGPRSRNPLRERRTRRARRATIVLLRVPNYFEDAATIAEAGSLESTIITDAFGSVAKDEWSLWKQTIKKLQKNDEGVYVKFERNRRGRLAAAGLDPLPGRALGSHQVIEFSVQARRVRTAVP